MLGRGAAGYGGEHVSQRLEQELVLGGAAGGHADVPRQAERGAVADPERVPVAQQPRRGRAIGASCA